MFATIRRLPSSSLRKKRNRRKYESQTVIDFTLPYMSSINFKMQLVWKDFVLSAHKKESHKKMLDFTEQ